MIEVLKQALEALETPKPLDDYPPILNAYAKTINNAITAIKEAIREHAMYEVQRLGQEIEQEPVAWMREDATLRFADGKMFAVGQPFYTHPPQRTEQNFCPRCGKRTNDIHTCTPPQGIYYTPPQRTWVGLEWNDMVDVLNEANGKSMELWEMFKALEAKLKERNT